VGTRSRRSSTNAIIRPEDGAGDSPDDRTANLEPGPERRPRPAEARGRLVRASNAAVSRIPPRSVRPASNCDCLPGGRPRRSVLWDVGRLMGFLHARRAVGRVAAAGFRSSKAMRHVSAGSAIRASRRRRGSSAFEREKGIDRPGLGSLQSRKDGRLGHCHGFAFGASNDVAAVIVDRPSSAEFFSAISPFLRD